MMGFTPSDCRRYWQLRVPIYDDLRPIQQTTFRDIPGSVRQASVNRFGRTAAGATFGSQVAGVGAIGKFQIVFDPEPESKLPP